MICFVLVGVREERETRKEKLKILPDNGKPDDRTEECSRTHRGSMTHKFFWRKILHFLNTPLLLRCYERTPADRRVSTPFRRFAIPGPITRLPGFRKAPRFILSSPLPSPPSFLRSPSSFSFLSTLTQPPFLLR